MEMPYEKSEKGQLRQIFDITHEISHDPYNDGKPLKPSDIYK